MKKFLSLVLALVMTMSLVTVSAGAEDFTDNGDITYEEAVDVISTIGVVNGYGDDTFKPQGGLTRQAAAKIICNLILGPTTAAELNATTAPFPDVPVTNEFSGYIAYCVKEGIISGYADGTFKGGNPLTGYAFMKMLLGALGYDAEQEGFVGDNWSINVAKLAIGIGLNASLEGEFNGSDYVNREEACLYAFNTLKATLVEYNEKTTVVVGNTILNTVVPAEEVSWGTAKANNDGNIDKDGHVQFAEKYFSKLEVDPTTDAFGRPARVWEFKGAEVGTYINHDLLVESYTVAVTGEDLYDLLGKKTINDYDVFVYVDGETEKSVLNAVAGNEAYFTAGNLVKTNDKTVGQTGKGVLTEVYVDSDEKEVTIAVINTYLAKATADYNAKKDEVSFTVWGIEGVNADKQYVKNVVKNDEVMTVSSEDFDVADVEKDDIVLVNVAEGGIQVISDAEVLADTEITSFKTNSNLTVDGTKYELGDTACYDAVALEVYTDGTNKINLKDTTYNVYMDEYGYVIGVEEVDPVDNYVFITGTDKNFSNLTQKTADVGAIFMDGTMDVIEVNVKKSDVFTNAKNGWDGTKTVATNAILNTWCTYTVNDDGVYTLKVAADQYAWDLGTGHSKEINKKSISLKASGTPAYVYGNDETVYLNVSLDNINVADNSNDLVSVIDDVDSVTTGIKNTDLLVKDINKNTVSTTKAADIVPIGDIYTLWDDDGYAIAVVAIGEDQGVSSNYAYVTSSNVEQEAYDKTTKDYTWSREVVIDGELTTISYVSDSLDVIAPSNSGNGKTDDTMDQNFWYKVTYYADGTVKSAEALEADFVADGSTELLKNINNVEEAVDDEELVVYSETFSSGSLKYENGSLYYINTAKTGFSVSPDVKVVLANADGLGAAFDTVDDEYVGYAGLESALDDMNGNFAGRLSAILEGGVATSIVINCTVADPGYNGGTNNNVNTNVAGISVNKETGVVSVTLGYVSNGQNIYADVTVTQMDNVAVKSTQRIVFAAGEKGGSSDFSAMMSVGKTYKAEVSIGGNQYTTIWAYNG